MIVIVFFLSLIEDFYEQKIMTDSNKVFNIYSSEPTPDPAEDNETFGELKRANASKSKTSNRSIQTSLSAQVLIKISRKILFESQSKFPR